VNDSELAETLSVVVGVIFNVTAIVCGVLVTVAGAVAVIVTVPV
jgi:hypothetical protein